MIEFLSHSTTAWVALSLVVFFVLIYKLAGKKIIGALDSKIESIRQELSAAKALREEALALLEEYKAKTAAAEDEARSIIEQAQKTAQMIHDQATKDLNETMARREAQLQERIKRMEEKAIADLQTHAATLAISATREIIAKSMDEKTSGNLIDQAIKAASKHLN